jgi:hypothetical protein
VGQALASQWVGGGGQASGHVLPKRGAVEPEVRGGKQADGFGAAVEDVGAEGLIEAMQGAAQAGAALARIALGPQQGGEMVAAVALAADRQVDQQRHCFAQVQFERPAVALETWLAQDQ